MLKPQLLDWGDENDGAWGRGGKERMTLQIHELQKSREINFCPAAPGNGGPISAICEKAYHRLVAMNALKD